MFHECNDHRTECKLERTDRMVGYLLLYCITIERTNILDMIKSYLISLLRLNIGDFTFLEKKDFNFRYLKKAKKK